MPLDAVCLSVVLQELRTEVLGCRIDKIQQPARDELILLLRGKAGALRLLLSASPTRPRAQLTQLARENPAEPPMFCMLLRKYLAGGRILEVSQPPMERLLIFHVEASNELGDKRTLQLVLEVMGRRANLLLVGEDGRIIDCLRKVDYDMSQERQLLPGMFYHLPPDQGKKNPLTFGEGEESPLPEPSNPNQKAEQYLMEQFGGISPLIARELSFEATGSVDGEVGAHVKELERRLAHLAAEVKNGETGPYLLLRDGVPVDFSFRPILQYGPGTQSQKQESFSALLDSFYAQKENSERIRQKGQDLIRSVTTARDRTARKLGFQAKELAETKDREALREKGDLITANLYRMNKGASILETENFYDPESPLIRIPLDPLKTPQQNAAKYYKDYTRRKTAEEHLTEQIAKGEEELRYLESVLESIARASGEQDLEEIRQELEQEGYLRRRTKGKTKMKRPSSKPMEFRSSSGLRISVGRNNSQNDQLTMKLAAKGDLWFHTKGIHGAHVILWTMGKSADEESIAQAAFLAAWFSQGKGGAKIPVDYTLVKYVKKPSGAKPGMVIYDKHETMYVAAQQEQFDAMVKE